MKDWRERLEKEEKQLSKKINKLIVFANEPEFDKLDQMDQDLLSTQLAAMVTYQSILEMRLTR